MEVETNKCSSHLILPLCPLETRALRILFFSDISGQTQCHSKCFSLGVGSPDEDKRKSPLPACLTYFSWSRVVCSSVKSSCKLLLFWHSSKTLAILWMGCRTGCFQAQSEGSHENKRAQGAVCSAEQADHRKNVYSSSSEARSLDL